MGEPVDSEHTKPIIDRQNRNLDREAHREGTKSGHFLLRKKRADIRTVESS